MTEAPAGTPTPQSENSPTAENTPAPKDDSKQVTVSEQFKKEALENWKPAAEKVNKLESDLQAANARIEQLARLAYGGGQAATDPRAELVAKLQEQAAYDPVAQAALMNMQDNIVTKAEKWLSDEMLNNEVPKTKRDGVSALIRASGYQMSVQDALSRVTDPEAGSLAAQVAELKAENERLKSAKPNGVSPATATPASTDADDGRIQETIERGEYLAILQRGQAPGATPQEKDRARALMQSVGSNKTRFKND